MQLVSGRENAIRERYTRFESEKNENPDRYPQAI